MVQMTALMDLMKKIVVSNKYGLEVAEMLHQRQGKGAISVGLAMYDEVRV